MNTFVEDENVAQARRLCFLIKWSNLNVQAQRFNFEEGIYTDFSRQMFLANVPTWERQASAWLFFRADQTVGVPGISTRQGRIFPAGRRHNINS
jgi:hypothetical protein